MIKFAIIKILISAVLIYIVNEIVIRHSKPLFGSMVASLPLVSLITFVWVWAGLRDNPEKQTEALEAHSTGVFWFVLPSLPMFLIFPWLLKKGLSFWPNLAICVVITALLYLGMTVILKRFGMEM